MVAITHTAMLKHLAPIGARVRLNAADECANERFIIHASEPETASRLARAPALRNRPVTTKQRSCFINPATCSRATPPLGVLLCPVIAGLRQFVEHLIEIHAVHLPFETARLLRLLLALSVADRVCASVSRPSASVPTSPGPRWPSSPVTDERVTQRFFNQGLVHPLRKTGL